MSDYTIPDLRKAVAETMRRRIVEFAREVENLQRREMKKSEEKPTVNAEAPISSSNGLPTGGADPCPLCGRPDAPGECKCVQDKGLSLSKTIPSFQKKPALKSEDFIDTKNEADPGKRLKEPSGHDGVLPDDKAEKKLNDAGSGSDPKAAKSEPPMVKPPSGINSATHTPTAKVAAPKLAGIKPKLSGPAKPFGKSELGSCALCKKAEHSGACN